MEDYFKNYVIYTPDDLQKKMKKIESMIRGSLEYRGYISYIHEEQEIKTCAYFKNWNCDDITEEFHHIITLYNITFAVGCKLLERLEPDEYLTTFDIAKEVILEHFNNNIPGIYLSKTIHEAYHAGLTQLPKNSNSLNLGNYKDFVKKYKAYLSKSDIENITYFLNESDKNELVNIYEKDQLN